MSYLTAALFSELYLLTMKIFSFKRVDRHEGILLTTTNHYGRPVCIEFMFLNGEKEVGRRCPSTMLAPLILGGRIDWWSVVCGTAHNSLKCVFLENKPIGHNYRIFGPMQWLSALGSFSFFSTKKKKKRYSCIQLQIHIKPYWHTKATTMVVSNFRALFTPAHLAQHSSNAKQGKNTCPLSCQFAPPHWDGVCLNNVLRAVLYFSTAQSDTIHCITPDCKK